MKNANILAPILITYFTLGAAAGPLQVSAAGRDNDKEPDCSLPDPVNHFAIANCVLKLASPGNNLKLGRAEIRMVVDGSRLTKVCVPGSASIRFGVFEIKGEFCVSVAKNRYGTSVCPGPHSETLVDLIPFKECFPLHKGEPMPVDYPYPLERTMFKDSLVLTALSKNPSDYSRLAIGAVLVSKHIKICDVQLPPRTELFFSGMPEEMKLQARAPDGMTIHGKRFPLSEEKLMLTDGTKCDVHFEDRAMDE